MTSFGVTSGKTAVANSLLCEIFPASTALHIQFPPFRVGGINSMMQESMCLLVFKYCVVLTEHFTG